MIHIKKPCLYAWLISSCVQQPKLLLKATESKSSLYFWKYQGIFSESLKVHLTAFFQNVNTMPSNYKMLPTWKEPLYFY